MHLEQKKQKRSPLGDAKLASVAPWPPPKDNAPTALSSSTGGAAVGDLPALSLSLSPWSLFKPGSSRLASLSRDSNGTPDWGKEEEGGGTTTSQLRPGDKGRKRPLAGTQSFKP